MFREHNLEADHWANLGAEGQRTVIVDRSGNTETGKAVKGFWDGLSKDNGKSGRGVVIKGVDRNTWVPISRIALPLRVSAAMASAAMGVCVLTEILDLVFQQVPQYSEYQPVH